MIATLMAPTGDSGVQSHFNAISRCASREGIDASIISPYRSSNLAMRRLGNLVTRVLSRINREWAALWYRRLDRELLRRQLVKELRALDAKEEVVIYAQDPGSAKAAMEAVAAKPNTRVVMVVHYNVSEAYEQALVGNTIEGGALYRSLLRLEQEAVPRVDVLIFPSRFMRDHVRARVPAVQAMESYVIANFSERVSESFDETVEADGDIISIGTLEQRKNQGFLIRVLAEANRVGHRYTLGLVGRGPSMQEFKDMARSLGVDGQVRFLGRVDGAAKLISRYKVYAHAALMENLPITLLEALSTGRPILAAPVGGIPEIFANGEEGLYWDLSDPSGAALLLISLLEDKDRYAKLAQAGVRRYESTFSPAVLVPVWLKAILAVDHTGSSMSEPLVHDHEVIGDYKSTNSLRPI